MFGMAVLPDWRGAYLLGVGVIAALAFLWWEMRVRHPLMDVRTFRHNPVFIMSNLSAMISYSATFAVSLLMSLYLQHIKGLEPQAAGLVLLSQPVLQTVFSPLMGRLSDRVQPRVLTSVGMAMNFFGLLALGFITSDTSMVYIILWLAFMGLGFAFFSSPNSNAAIGSVSKRDIGTATSTLATMRSLGQMFSLGFATLMFAIYIGNVQIVEANYPQLLSAVKTAFFIFAGLCFLGIFASLARGSIKRNNSGMGE